jgi:FtsH-binding integral membrane protein
MANRYETGMEKTGARAGMVTDEGLRAYMLKVYNYMTSGVLLTGIVALLAYSSPAISGLLYSFEGGFITGYTALGWVAVISPLAFVLFMSFGAHKMKVMTLQAMFWGFAATMGLSLSSIFFIYAGGSIATIFFITAAAFGSLSLWGYTTKKDLSGWGTFLFMGLIGVIIAMVVNWFLASPMLYFVYSAAGVLIFAGLTAYDTQKIKNMYYQYQDGTMAKKGAIMGALSLYLDFINMFLFLLRLFGNRN